MWKQNMLKAPEKLMIVRRMSLPDQKPIYLHRFYNPAGKAKKKIINAYRKILNEPYLTAGVRALIRTQLNGILYAFLQLKLLSVTDFTNLIGKETITI